MDARFALGRAAVAEALIDMLLRLVDALRDAGVPVAMVEVLDAAAALQHLDVGDRSQLRSGLRAALVKNGRDEALFEALFDRCFAPTGVSGPGPAPAPARRAPQGDPAAVGLGGALR